MASLSKALLIFGPTGVGKSAIAVAVARLVDAEIINIDPQQAYQHFNIGTNKPKLSEKSAVPHHLYDILDIFDSKYDTNTSKWFTDSVQSLVTDIRARNRVPIFVGGSRLYASFLIRGAAKRPPVNWTNYAQLYHECQHAGWDKSFKILMQKDPVYAKTVRYSDWLYLVKGLYVLKESDQLLSSFQATPLLSDDTPLYHINLETSRTNLYNLLDRRCEDMIRAGLLQETMYLFSRIPATPRRDLRLPFRINYAPFNAIGYRQCMNFLRFLSQLSKNPESSSIETRQLSNFTFIPIDQFMKLMSDFQTTTRNLAREQLTFANSFVSKDNRYVFNRLNMPRPPSTQEAVDRVAHEIVECITTGSNPTLKTVASKEASDMKKYQSVAKMTHQEYFEMVFGNNETASNCWEWCQHNHDKISTHI